MTVAKSPTRTRAASATKTTTKKTTTPKAKAAPKVKVEKDAAPAAKKASVYDQPAKVQAEQMPSPPLLGYVMMLVIACMLAAGLTQLDKSWAREKQKPATVHQQAPKPQPRKASVYASGDSVAECEVRNKRFSNMPPADCGKGGQ